MRVHTRGATGKLMSPAHGQRNRAITHGGKPEERVGGSVLKPPYSKYSRGGCMSAYAITRAGAINNSTPRKHAQ